MAFLKIGLLREGKVPADKRVAFTPKQALEIQQRYPEVKIICQPSEVRCYKDQEYTDQGIEVSADISDCNFLMGIKEVPIDMLLDSRFYLFFSHTIKKQPYNRRLLQNILKKKIHLIDYEALKDHQGNRLVAFGRYAGIVGAHNGLWTYGKRYNLFTLPRAFTCFDINELKLELRKIKLPPIKIILTGAGRVAKGAMETLDTAGIRKVSPHEFLTGNADGPVYVQLSSADYHERKDGDKFNREEFHTFPERYRTTFFRFAASADILMAGAYWNPRAPVLFTKEEMASPEFRIKIISDITCDIGGSIPSTKQPSSIPDPVYDYDPMTDMVQSPFSNEKFITVMAIDNLPCELPRSASEEFGRDLIDRILQPLLSNDPEGIINRASVTNNGALGEAFLYLGDYVDDKS